MGTQCGCSEHRSLQCRLSFSSPAEGNLSSLKDHTTESGRQEFSRTGQQVPLGHPFSEYSVKLSFLLEVANWMQILWFLILFYCGKNILHAPYPLTDLSVRDATLLTAGTMLDSRSLEPSHLARLKLCACCVVTPHLRLPPVASNHHSTL